MPKHGEIKNVLQRIKKTNVVLLNMYYRKNTIGLS